MGDGLCGCYIRVNPSGLGKQDVVCGLLHQEAEDKLSFYRAMGNGPGMG